MKKFLKVGRLLLVLCLLVFATLSFCACDEKTNPFVEESDTVITLNSDGSIFVREKNVVEFGRRDDPWWNYYKTVSLKGTTISNVKIRLDGKELSVGNISKNPDDFSFVDKYSYANTGYVYDRGTYCEVGVFMSEFSKGRKTVEFEYSLTDIMVGYADCAGFYYKFIDESNEMYYGKVTATVKFAETAKEDIRVWTHLEAGNGEGIIPEGDTVSQINYTAEGIYKGEYFETRLLLPKDGYTLEKTDPDTMKGIADEESKWQAAFYKKVKLIGTLQILDYVAIAVVALAAAAILLLLIKKRKPLKLDDSPIYLREIPAGWSAGEAAPLYHYYGKYEVGDAISATILELFRRHFIDIQAGDKKKGAEITVLQRDTSILLPHEKKVYEMLSRMSGGSSFTMKEFEKAAEKKYAEYAAYIEEFKNLSGEKVKRDGLIPSSRSDKYGSMMSKVSVLCFIIAAVLFFCSFIFSEVLTHIPYTTAVFVVAGVAFIIAYNKQKRPLNERGQREYDKFFALGKFMTEFSNMDSHELPSLIIWEEYMVYATAMGIADKVAEQLEIAYPEYRQMVSQATNNSTFGRTYAILWLMSPRVRLHTGFMLASSVNTVCRSVFTMQRNAKAVASVRKFTSGSGKGGGFGGFGGGGFSGGGGGFGGGGSHAR